MPDDAITISNTESNNDTISDEQQFEIETQEETRETEEKGIDLSGALPEEIELAKMSGILIEEADDDEHTEQSESTTEEDSGTKEKEKEEEVAIPTFEEAEQDESLVEKYDANAKAFYWKWKNEKHKRQEAQHERDEQKATIDLNKIKGNVSSRKLEEIKAALGKDDLTVEMIQSIIEAEQKSDDETPVTRAEFKKAEEDKKQVEAAARERNLRLLNTEKIGKAKYSNFDDIVKVANDVVGNDKTNTYQDVLAATFNDPNLSEEQVIDKVVSIAKLSPTFEEDTKSVKTEDKNKVNRAIKNSKKKVSSAAIGTSGSKRMVNENELTPDDVANWTADKFMKLKSETQKRLLGG